MATSNVLIDDVHCFWNIFAHDVQCSNQFLKYFWCSVFFPNFMLWNLMLRPLARFLATIILFMLKHLEHFLTSMSIEIIFTQLCPSLVGNPTNVKDVFILNKVYICYSVTIISHKHSKQSGSNLTKSATTRKQCKLT
jgi:hypothetical protein